MTRTIRLAVLGMSHDHVWDFIKHAQTTPGVDIVVAADPDSILRAKAVAHGIATTSADTHAVLTRSDIDAVAIFADNRASVALGIAAAQRGMHVLVEKPIAADYAGAVALTQAAHRAGVSLMVNWPIAWWATVQYAITLIERGRIGRLFQVQYRAAHGGPRELGCSPQFVDWLYDPYRNGAGVIMDYCCYGAALTCMFLGLPARVTAVAGRLRKEDLPAEDNAVLVMQHASAISTATASWTQQGHLTSYEPMFYGDKGTLVVRGGKLLLSDVEHDEGTVLRVPKIAPGYTHAVEHFAAVIRGDVALMALCSPQVALMAQHVLEAGVISANTNEAVSLPLPPAALYIGGTGR
ncbi:MAG: Gfo/Idh/MocA family protein [Roseiflexaceae bacterium]|jgi:predicted dehydrogenase